MYGFVPEEGSGSKKVKNHKEVTSKNVKFNDKWGKGNTEDNKIPQLKIPVPLELLSAHLLHGQMLPGVQIKRLLPMC